MEAKEFSETWAAMASAHWAAWSAVAAWVIGIASLLTNLAAIILVYRQLQANRQALRDTARSADSAADAARASLMTSRPWVKLEVQRIFFGFSGDAERRLTCQVDYQIENIGQTPAVQCGIVYQPMIFDNTKGLSTCVRLL